MGRTGGAHTAFACYIYMLQSKLLHVYAAMQQCSSTKDKKKRFAFGLVDSDVTS